MEEIKFWVAINYFSKFGPKRFKKLKKYFPDMKTAFNASPNELIRAGIENNIVDEFIATRHKIDPNQLIDNINKEKIKIITINDQNYPRLLKEIYSPPYILYYKGNIKQEFEFTIAIVGSRKYTSYGQQVTEELSKNLAQNKLTIVSGLALGIDTIAHTACLEAKGLTIAVLGSGIDKQNLYPSLNRYLVDKIILNNGCVLSEFPPGTAPLKHNFPQRNRIISGLSLGTIVIEAKKKSGSLITANYALEQNREVFAVPGNIYSLNSEGTNNLIKSGAKLVSSADDIIETLNLTKATEFINNKKIIPESIEEKEILSFLSHEPIHIDELARFTKFNSSKISSTLIMMEMKGIIRNLGGMQYVIAR